MRTNAGNNINDSNNISPWSDSAGAGLSLLIGFHSLFNPNPIKVIFFNKPQATNDLQKCVSEISSGICSSSQICDILTFDPNPKSPPDFQDYIQSMYELGVGTYSCNDILNINNSN